MVLLIARWSTPCANGKPEDHKPSKKSKWRETNGQTITAFPSACRLVIALVNSVSLAFAEIDKDVPARAMTDQYCVVYRCIRCNVALGVRKHQSVMAVELV